MRGEEFTLKECLAEFLKGTTSEMPIVDARIISLQPLKVTDDDIHYFEIPGLEDAAQRQNQSLSKKKDANKLVLTDWTYTFKKVPNSHDYYIDISA